MSKLTLRDAISKGLAEALDSNEKCFLLGEDIGEYGGAYAVTKGFLDKYGEKRVRDMPIAESVIAGTAIGSTCRPGTSYPNRIRSRTLPCG